MINVLIIDDDAMVAELNRRYVAQIPGFQCCGTASTLEKAKEIIFNSDTPIDLILLDIYMQKENGLDLLPVLHNARCKSDVIVISSAADAATIKDSLHYGVVDYLIKPFQASRFEEALTGWRQKKMALEKHQYYDQAELDQLIHRQQLQRTGDSPSLAKRLNAADVTRTVPADSTPGIRTMNFQPTS